MRPVILFLVDGLRPDALQESATPTIDRLIDDGLWTPTARTVMPSVTLPCITSLVLSSSPEEHHVTSNIWTSPRVGPGIFDAVAEAGGRAASFYNWEQLRDLSRPGALQAGVYLNNSHAPGGSGDLELAKMAASYLREHTVDFTFVYLGYTDVAGHDHGWMSVPYLEAVENADGCIATVLESVQDWEDLLIVVTSDHGGHETHHGTAMAEDMTTPVVLAGATDDEADRMPVEGVSILDITPTIAAWMGLPRARAWRGRNLL